MFGERVMTRIVVDKSTDHDKPHFDLIFFTAISTLKKMFFFSERKLKNVLRDTLTRADCGLKARLHGEFQPG